MQVLPGFKLLAMESRNLSRAWYKGPSLGSPFSLYHIFLSTSLTIHPVPPLFRRPNYFVSETRWLYVHIRSLLTLISDCIHRQLVTTVNIPFHVSTPISSLLFGLVPSLSRQSQISDTATPITTYPHNINFTKMQLKSVVLALLSVTAVVDASVLRGRDSVDIGLLARQNRNGGGGGGNNGGAQAAAAAKASASAAAAAAAKSGQNSNNNNAGNNSS